MLICTVQQSNSIIHTCVWSRFSHSLRPYGLRPARLLSPWNSPGKKPGPNCHGLLQGIFLTQGLNPHLLSPALAGRSFTTSAIWEAHIIHILLHVLLHDSSPQDSECHPVLCSGPCCYPFYTEWFASAKRTPPVTPPLPPAPLAQVCPPPLSLFLPHRQAHLCHTLDSTHTCCHTVFVSLFLTDFI